MSWVEWGALYGLTPTEAKIFAALRDGAIHTSHDLQLNGIGKRFAAKSLVPTHIGRLRPKLAAHGFVLARVGGTGRNAQGYQLRVPAPSAGPEAGR